MDVQQIIYSTVSFLIGLSIVMPYIAKLQALLKECAELLIVLEKAPEGGISKEDIASIKKEAIDVWLAIKAFKK